jgi:predicted dehydrogenase
MNTSQQETLKETLNVAVVGAGLFGQVHLNAYAQHANANLKLVCDLDAKRRRQVEKEFGAQTCDDYRAVLEDETIDAVSVVTPDFLHREIVTAMLQAGKHVIVEKPLATTVADARAMVKAAQKSGKTLMVDFHNRWNPPFAEAKKRIAAGEFGEPVMAAGRLSNTLFVPLKMLAWAGQSGPHWFLFPHIMDVVCWLFDREPQRVTAIGRKGILSARGIDTYDAIQTLVEFEDCSATFDTSWIIPETFPSIVDFSCVLFGTKGRLEVARPYQLEVTGPKRNETPFVGALGNFYGRWDGWQLAPITHFVDCLLENRAPICKPEEAFRNTALICAVEKSIETGKTAKVEKL